MEIKSSLVIGLLNVCNVLQRQTVGILKNYSEFLSFFLSRKERQQMRNSQAFNLFVLFNIFHYNREQEQMARMNQNNLSTFLQSYKHDSFHFHARDKTQECPKCQKLPLFVLKLSHLIPIRSQRLIYIDKLKSK